jgi:hypothetical protein
LRKWKYKAEELSFSFGIPVDELNNMGAEGWELVKIVPVTDIRGTKHIGIFKKSYIL